MLIFAGYSEKSQGEAFSWSNAVAETRKYNSSILKASEELKSSKYIIKSNRNGYYPSLTLNLGFLESDSDSMFSKTKNFNTSLELRQNIYRGLNDKFKVNEYESRSEISYENLRQVKAQVSYDLKRSFTELSFSQENLKLANEIVTRRTQNLHLIQLRYEGGKENQGSVLLGKASVISAKYDLLQVTHTICLAQKEFAKTIGRDRSDDLSVIGEASPIVIDVNQKIEDLVLSAPTYLKAIGEVKVSQYQLSQIKSSFLPTVDISGNIGKSDSSFFPEKDAWSIGINFNMPLFNGGKDFYAKKSGVNKLYAAKAEVLNSKRKLLVDIQKDLFDFQLAAKKQEVDRAFLAAALVRAKIAQEKYNNGLMTFEDWEIIENDLTLRKNNYLLAKKNKIFAEARFELTQGTGVLK